MSINIPYDLAWNTVVKFGLVPVTATWICQVSYKNRHAGLLVIQFLLPLNPGLIVEILTPLTLFIGNIRMSISTVSPLEVSFLNLEFFSCRILSFDLSFP